MLRRGVGAEKRKRAPAGDRADEDDAPARAAQVRQERLRHGDLTDHVDLELATELLERDELERDRNRDPRVVDERVELADLLGRLRDLIRVSDVEQNLVRTHGRIAFATHGGEHAPARGDETRRAGCADSRGRARHEGAAHQSSSQAAIFARCSRE